LSKPWDSFANVIAITSAQTPFSFAQIFQRLRRNCHGTKNISFVAFWPSEIHLSGGEFLSSECGHREPELAPCHVDQQNIGKGIPRIASCGTPETPINIAGNHTTPLRVVDFVSRNRFGSSRHDRNEGGRRSRCAQVAISDQSLR